MIAREKHQHKVFLFLCESPATDGNSLNHLPIGSTIAGILPEACPVSGLLSTLRTKEYNKCLPSMWMISLDHTIVCCARRAKSTQRRAFQRSQTNAVAFIRRYRARAGRVRVPAVCHGDHTYIYMACCDGRRGQSDESGLRNPPHQGRPAAIWRSRVAEILSHSCAVARSSCARVSGLRRIAWKRRLYRHARGSVFTVCRNRTHGRTPRPGASSKHPAS